MVFYHTRFRAAKKTTFLYPYPNALGFHQKLQTMDTSNSSLVRGTVYIETSIVSYLTARPSRDLLVAAHQQLTVAWWDQQRSHYEIFTSQVVLAEAREGDPDAAQRRVAVLEPFPLLDVTDAAIMLAAALVSGQALPAQAAQDALHVAVACVHGMEYLLTWNCAHLANARLRSRIEQICREAGYVPPIICTPEELEG
jgi:predicted nucleic acid-binding protein